MKKILAIIFNDIHLKTGNELDVLNAFEFMIQYARKNSIKKLIFAGDLFDSRTAQRQEVLQTFDKMLKLVEDYNLELDIFPGNHDKTTYASFDSFLDVYRHYPNVNFYKEITDVKIGDLKITYLPFFSDDMLIPMLEKHKGGDVLISHFEMAGSTHLGSVSEKTSINQKMLKKWDKVYLGHYHNYHEISKDIVHLPSFIQASFGEDNVKGFSLLYDDASYELVKGRFKEFTKLNIDINVNSIDDIKRLVKQYKNSSDTIRFELTGDESKLKAFDKSIFKDTGIDLKIKYEAKYSFDESELEMPQVIQKFDKNSVFSSFQSFCEAKGYDYEIGAAMLTEFLKTKDGSEK